MRVAGVLLGGGKSTRFGGPKLEATLGGRRLVDLACEHFLSAGLDPVVFVGRARPEDPRVRVAEPGAAMIDTLRRGLEALPEIAFAFAPADMPALDPVLIRRLREAFAASGRPFLIPSYAGRRGHPAFARSREPFFQLGDERGAREVWQAHGDEIEYCVVETADVLFDVDTPEDLAAAGDAQSRLERLVARGDLAR